MAGLGHTSNIPGTGSFPGKEELKRSLDPTPGKVDAVKEIYPSVAPGMRPSQPVIDAAIKAADYYRNGGTQGSVTYPERTFIGFETDSNEASIRIFGRGAKGKQDRDLIPAYSKFFLESVQESRSERSQIVETFGDFYVFMFGEKPSVYNFTGQLVNAKNANWVTDFMLMYELYLRGTKCVELDARTIITYGGRQIEGFILGISTQTNAAVEGAVGLSFQVIVTDKKYYGFSGDMGAFTQNGVSSTDRIFQDLMRDIAGKEGTKTSTPAVDTAQQAVKKAMAGGDKLSGFIKAVA